jgi:hypothetical protein
MSFIVTPDALVEIASIVRIQPVKGEDGTKLMFCAAGGVEHRFLLTPDDCRHVAALLLKDLPPQESAADQKNDGSVGASDV